MGNISNYTNNLKDTLNLFSQVSMLNSQLSELLGRLPECMESTYDIPIIKNSDDFNNNNFAEALEQATMLVNEHKKMCDECSVAYMQTAIGLKDIYKLFKPVADLEELTEKFGGDNNGRDNS